MKCRSQIFTLVATVLALSCVVGLVAHSSAAENTSGASKDDKKSGASAEDLRKYDRNRNGKLDPDEEAAMRADEARARREQDRKKGN